MHSAPLLLALSSHRAYDADECVHQKNTFAFVEANVHRFWQRSTLEGHITASAWVIDRTRTHALLLHHAKLDRWLQPGGHLDDSDASPAAGAQREVMEETGLAALTLADDRLFDVDVHAIPARGAEPAHLHYDLRYLIISTKDNVSISGESLGARWIRLEALALPPFGRSIARMAEKTLYPKLS